MQFNGGGVGRGGEGPTRGGIVQYNHGPQFLSDHRDASLAWLRGEFAAANAIIDMLYDHIRSFNGSSGEYDAVMDAIDRRRSTWMSVIHMQKHGTVDEVTNALDQVAWRRSHHRNHHSHYQRHRQQWKRSESGFKQEQRVEPVKEVQNSHGDMKVDENKSGNRGDNRLKPTEDKRGKDDGLEQDNKNIAKSSVELEESEVAEAETEVEAADESGCSTGSKENDVDACQDQNAKPNVPPLAKTFAATEMYNGMMVNVVQGLNLYEEVMDRKEVSKFVSLVNDLRAAGKAGKLIGQTYAAFRRPMRGRGKEVIQLGLPILDAPLDNNNAGVAVHVQARKVEAIPAQLQDVIARLVDMQMLSVKPDSCIIDLYDEGEYSQPHMFLPWFGRPVAVLFLSECDMSFGRAIKYLWSGNYEGSINLSFASGSLIVMEGQSANFSNHAINATRNQRILITFTRLQPIKSTPHTNMPSYWVPPRIQPPNHTQNSVDPKNHRQTYPPGASLAQPQTHHLHSWSANNFQPIFAPAPVSPPLAYNTSGLIPQHGLVGWGELQYLVPGTGVFIPFECWGSGFTQRTNLAITEGAPYQVNSNISTKGHVKDNNIRNDDVDEEKQQRDCKESLNKSFSVVIAAAKDEDFSEQSPENDRNKSNKSNVEDRDSQKDEVDEEKQQRDCNRSLDESSSRVIPAAKDEDFSEQSPEK